MTLNATGKGKFDVLVRDITSGYVVYGCDLSLSGDHEQLVEWTVTDSM